MPEVERAEQVHALPLLRKTDIQEADVMASRGTYDTRGIRRVRDEYTFEQIADLTGFTISQVRRDFRKRVIGVRRDRAGKGKHLVSRPAVLDYLRRRGDRIENAIFNLITEVADD